MNYEDAKGFASEEWKDFFEQDIHEHIRSVVGMDGSGDPDALYKKFMFTAGFMAALSFAPSMTVKGLKKAADRAVEIYAVIFGQGEGQS